MPIPLGILAAAGFRPAGGAAFELLESTVLTGSQNSVSFTNLTTKYAATYQHLQLRIVASHTGSGGNALAMTLNGDSGANYSYHEMVGGGSSVSSSGLASQSSILGVVLLRQNISNTSFGAGVVDILDAFETTKNKTVRSFSGHASSPNSIVGLSSGARLNTASVTSITMFMSANDIGANSRFSLYGIRSA
jgi:hypothetical protein